jgi:putative transposase
VAGALEKGLNREFPAGVRGHGLKLMSDNGSQPTSLSFMKACSNLEVGQVFTSYNNPKGNADTERMIRTMKEELFWLREWENERELSQELNKWIEYYNRSYLHSALGYSPPIQAEEKCYSNHTSHLNAA